jgi:Zn-dependent peptidase ImmA (M78 family)
LVTAIQTKLDIEVLFVDTDGNQPRFGISGATCHLPDMTVILINRQEPVCRQYFDMAHELFHALTWDAMEPAHRDFAAALLMPQASLEHFIDTKQINNLSELIRTAKALQVAPSALAWRLFNLKLIDAKTLQLLKAQPNKSSQKNMPKRFSDQYISLLHEAIDQGRLSARKASKILGMSLPEFRGLFEEHAMSVPFEI